jgi:hypothetical protein
LGLGPVLECYQERGTALNSARYSEMLIDRLKPAILNKRRGLLSKGVVLCFLLWTKGLSN